MNELKSSLRAYIKVSFVFLALLLSIIGSKPQIDAYVLPNEPVSVLRYDFFAWANNSLPLPNWLDTSLWPNPEFYADNLLKFQDGSSLPQKKLRIRLYNSDFDYNDELPDTIYISLTGRGYSASTNDNYVITSGYTDSNGFTQFGALFNPTSVDSAGNDFLEDSEQLPEWLINDLLTDPNSYLELTVNGGLNGNIALSRLEIYYLGTKEDGYTEGFGDGFILGDFEGYQLGYSEGFDDGIQAEGDFSLTWIGAFFGLFDAVFGIQILPNLTVGTIVLIPIAFALIFFFLKMIRG